MSVCLNPVVKLYFAIYVELLACFICPSYLSCSKLLHFKLASKLAYFRSDNPRFYKSMEDCRRHWGERFGCQVVYWGNTLLWWCQYRHCSIPLAVRHVQYAMKRAPWGKYRKSEKVAQSSCLWASQARQVDARLVPREETGALTSSQKFYFQ